MYFVKDKNVKVILTTHSPSTVALAPEDSLYQMNKDEPRIIKTNKDKAISILTSGVPSLSITYENRRQVFVESKNDVVFYEKIYQKLKGKLVEEISINFISSGVNGQGNCDQVKEVVNKLSEFGNKSIYGVIDWDGKNNGNEYVKVLGQSKRYSIENYIFDPLVIAAFLLREKHITRNQIGLDENENYTDFVNYDSNKLQVIADFIFNSVKDSANSQLEIQLKKSTLINESQIEIPSWYMTIKGHDLEEQIKNKYPPLKAYKNEGDLKKAVIETIIDDIPSILSTDLVDLLKSIQKH